MILKLPIQLFVDGTYIGCCYVVTFKVEFLSIHKFPLYDSSSKTRLLCWIDAWRNAGYTAPCSLLCCFCKPFDLTLKAVLCQTEVEAKRERTLSVQSRGPSINDAVLRLLPSWRTSGASKGQLISKCLFGVFNSSKKWTKTIQSEV